MTYQFIGECPKCGTLPRMVANAGQYFWTCMCPPVQTYTSDNTGTANEQTATPTDEKPPNFREMRGIFKQKGE